MRFLIGNFVVWFCVIYGYTAHGDLRVLWQPYEFIIIFGSGMGAFMIGNPPSVIKGIISTIFWQFRGKPYGKNDYMELLQFLFEVFKLMKTKGMLQIEAHIENPSESDIFQKYPTINRNHLVVEFFCDNLRLITLGVDNHYVIEDSMNGEIKMITHEEHHIAHSMNTFGEALPALGIVAAILMVIVTMGSIAEPPEILGKLIAAALVGSFSGILLSYALFSPIGQYANFYAEEKTSYLHVLKVGIISHLQGNAPAVSVEFARKIIPEHEKPSFEELDKAINS